MLWWVAETTFVVAVLAIVLLIVGRARRAQPAVLHLLWLVALLKFIVPPISPGLFAHDDVRHKTIETVRLLSPFESRGPYSSSMMPIERKLKYTPRARPEEEKFGGVVDESAHDGIEKVGGAPETVTESPASMETAVDHGDQSGSGAEAVLAGPRLAAFDWSALGWGLVGLWIVGVLLSAWRQFRRVRTLSQLVDDAVSAPRKLEALVAGLALNHGVRPPRVKVTPAVGGPVVVALPRPVLLWPADLPAQPDSEFVHTMLHHELAHLKRWDHIVAWLELVVMCTWWWHPLQWVVRAQLRAHAEHACDAMVISAAPRSRRVYAEALIDVSSRRPRFTLASPALGVASAGRRMFERRLTMIMHHRGRSSVPKPTFAIIAILGLLILPGWASGFSFNSIAIAVTSDEAIDADVQKAIARHDLRRASNSAVQKGDWDRVGKLSEKLIALDPVDGEAYHWLGYSLIASDQPGKALKAFQRQADIGYRVPTAAYNTACAHARLGDQEAALASLADAVKLGFDQPKLMREDSDLESLRDSEQFTQLAEDSAYAVEMRDVAKEFFDDESWTDAAKALREVTTIQPRNKQVLHRLGFALVRAGDHERAINAFKRELELDPADPITLYNIACCHALMEQPEPALRSLSDAIDAGFFNLELLETDPDLDPIRDSTSFTEVAERLRVRHTTWTDAKSAFQEKDWDRAAKLWGIIVEARPEMGDAWHHYGFATHQLGHYDRSIDAFEREAALGHALDRSLYNIACGHAMAGHEEAALAHLARAVDCGFDDVDLMMSDPDLKSIRDAESFNDSMRRAGDYAVLQNFGAASWKEVREESEQAVADDPENGRAWNRLGFARLRLGDADGARDAFKQQLEVGFAEGNAMYNLACVAAYEEDSDEAIKWLGNAFDTGFDQYDFAWNDPDLASLRSDERFREMIREGAVRKEEATRPAEKSHRDDGA